MQAAEIRGPTFLNNTTSDMGDLSGELISIEETYKEVSAYKK